MNFKRLGPRDRELILNSKGKQFSCPEGAARRLIKRGLCVRLSTDYWTGHVNLIAHVQAMDVLFNDPLYGAHSNWFLMAFNRLFKRFGIILMLMALGPFRIALRTQALETLNDRETARIAKMERAGSMPTKQFLGPGDRTIEIKLDHLQAGAFTGWPVTGGS